MNYKYLVYLDKQITLFRTQDEIKEHLKQKFTANNSKKSYGVHTVYVHKINTDGSTARMSYPWEEEE